MHQLHLASHTPLCVIWPPAAVIFDVPQESLPVFLVYCLSRIWQQSYAYHVYSPCLGLYCCSPVWH